jgi:Tfp pilus assembly protein PilF
MTRPAHDSRRRDAAGLIAPAVALALGLGCRTATPQRDATSPPATAPAKYTVADGIKGDPAFSRTGFEAKAKPEQELGVHMEMGRGHEAQGQLEAAAVDYLKALEFLEKPGRRHESARDLAGRKATAHRKLAVVLDRLGRFPESDVHYKAALKAAPDDPKVWNNAGYSLYIQRRWDESERALRTAARLAPDDPAVATNLGLTLAAQQKVDEAMKVMARAVGPAAARANIGFVLAATGRRAEAVAQYRLALDLQPSLPEAEAALARLAKDGEPSATAKADELPPLPADRSIKPASAEAPAKRGLFGSRR